MAESKSSDEPVLDEDGLIIQKWKCRLLVILPPEGFGDQTLRYLRSSLHNIHVGTWVVSPESEHLIKGRLQDEILVDGALADAEMDEFAGLIVAGCEGDNSLAADAKVQSLVKAADSDGKLICGWGNALDVFAKAGILRGRKVTGPEGSIDAARAAGAKVRAREVQACGHLLTGRDESSGMRLGQLLTEKIRISEAEEALRREASAASAGRMRRRLFVGLGVVVGLVVLVKATIDLFGSLHAS